MFYYTYTYFADCVYVENIFDSAYYIINDCVCENILITTTFIRSQQFNAF